MWIGNLVYIGFFCSIYIVFYNFFAIINTVLNKKWDLVYFKTKLNLFSVSFIILSIAIIYISKPYAFEYSTIESDKIKKICIQKMECPRQIAGWEDYPYFPKNEDIRLTQNFGWLLYYQLDYERHHDGKGFTLKTWWAFDSIAFYSKIRI